MKQLNLLSKIDKILFEKDLDRKKLAAKMGCTVQNIQKVLSTGDPKLSFCLKLSEVLKTNMFDLFEIENTYTKKNEKATINEPSEQYEIQNPVLKRLDKIIEILENKENITKKAI